ncbi:MAG: nucleotidyl transferase AbiEii/AbiGii toxin family protein [Thermodesulfobacteriota bacterium]
MEKINFPYLYALQDKVLQAVFTRETSFYLTGGTCLHRFFYEFRYSADLDLFTSANNTFHEDVRDVKECLEKVSLDYEPIVESRDFVRLKIENKLQVDLVNDRVYRLGRSQKNSQGIRIDNIENICANKICAVLGRDDPKDVFDIYVIYSQSNIEWPEIVKATRKKCALDPEILEFRLNSFPLDLLKYLNVLNKKTIDQMEQNYSITIKNILDYF